MKAEKTKLLVAIEALENAGFTVDKAEMETSVDAGSTSERTTGKIVLRCSPDSKKGD